MGGGGKEVAGKRGLKRAPLKGMKCEPPPQEGTDERQSWKVEAGTPPSKSVLGISVFSQLPPIKHIIPSTEGDVHRVQSRDPHVHASS